jgi:cyclopropane fatty-acyl-phospholipid synthase-like methyltransferase
MESAKLMKLYDRVDRIHHELRALGIADDASLDVRQLAQFDQYHYHGTDAVDVAAARLGLDSTSHVLDVGAGIGGPARWLAATTGCRVTAIELQPDLNETAADLTRRSGLADRIAHVAGNILDGAPDPGTYDALISYLVFLHIPDRVRLFAACHQALRPGAGMYIEDFTLLSEPTPEQREALRVKVQCPYVPSPEVYVEDIAGAGFASVEFEDVTADWTAFTAERAASFRTSRDRQVRVHGGEVAAGLEDFFETMAGLYADGVLGGARIVARR